MKVVILGAGISGLSAAWFLRKKYGDRIDLSIYEKTERPGGWVKSLQKEGFLFELGPRGFRPQARGQTTLELIHDIGLGQELLSANPHARKRYIYLKGKLHLFSLGFLLRQGMLAAIWRDIFTPAACMEDETIADFFTRRFNCRLKDALIDPLTKGIFGGDCKKLSMRSCLPLLWDFEQKKGSVIRGFFSQYSKRQKIPTPLYTFKEGMETLPRTLSKKIECPIYYSKTINSLKEIETDCVISAIPTYALCHLIPLKDPIVEYATLTTVNLGWRENVLKKHGYGFLVPSKENEEILGMTWDSEIFPPHNQTRICVMISGAPSKKEAEMCALNSIKRYLSIETLPLCMHAHTSRKAIPQYTFYHHRRKEMFKKSLPSRLHVIGNCLDGVSINDCIFNAKKAIDGLSL